MDLATYWYKVGSLHPQSKSDQRNTFARSWIFRNDSQKLLQADNEYKNGEFQYLYAEWKVNLQVVAADKHKANGVVKRASWTLWTLSNGLYAASRRMRMDYFVLETTYQKS